MGMFSRISDTFSHGYGITKVVHGIPGLSRDEQKHLLSQQVRIDNLRDGARRYAEGDFNDRAGRIGGRGRFRAEAGPQTEISENLDYLMGEARSFSRVNSLGKQASKIWMNAIVGTGFNMSLDLPKDTGKRARDYMEKLMFDFFENPCCDAYGKMTFYEITKLAVLTMIIDGGSLIRILPRDDKAVDIWGQPLVVPMQMKVLEYDYLYDGPQPQIQQGNSYFRGIEFAPGGTPVRYWLYRTHKGDPRWNPNEFDGIWAYDPQTKAPQIIHLFKMERSGQTHGFPWGMLAVAALAERADLKRSLLRRKRVEYRIQTYIKAPKMNLQAKNEMFGGQRSVSNILNTRAAADPSLPRTPEEMEAWSGAMREKAYDQTVDDNTVVFLPDNWDVQTNQMTSATDFAPLMEELKRDAMNGYGLPYEIGTGDLKMTTYSSGKIGMITWKTELASLQQMVVDEMLVPVWRAFNIYCKLARLVSIDMKCQFQADKLSALEPLKEAEADIAEFNMGVTDWLEQVTRRGRDPATVIANWKKTFEMWDEAGLGWVMGKDGILGPGRFTRVGTAGQVEGANAPSRQPQANDNPDPGRD